MFFKKKKNGKMELPALSSKLPELPPLLGEGQKTTLPSMPTNIPEKIPGIGEEIGEKSLISEIEKHQELDVPDLEEKKVEKLQLKKESFVKIGHYQDMLGTINLIKGMINGTTDSINKAIDIKNTKDAEFESWQGSLQDIGKKLMQIDRSLFERVI